MIKERPLPALLAHLELDLAQQGGQHHVEIADPGDRVRISRPGGAAERRAGHGLGGGDTEPGGHAGALVDRGRLPQLVGEMGQHLEQMITDLGHQLGLLAEQCDLLVQLDQIVGADLRAEPVLQRRDDPTAVGVVLRVCRGDQEHIQRQPQRVTADLDVPLFQHIEQRDLDPLGQIGQLVQSEHSPIRSRDQPVVHGLRITQRAALGHLDRVDVSDQVADRGVRGRQLLGVAVVAVPPADRQVVAVFGGQSPAADADRRVRVVVDLATGDLGTPLVEQGGHGAHQPGLALAALPQQHEVVAGQDGALQLGQHGVVEANDAGEGRLRRAKPTEQVGAQFVLGSPGAVPRCAELTHCGGLRVWWLAHRLTLRLRPNRFPRPPFAAPRR